MATARASAARSGMAAREIYLPELVRANIPASQAAGNYFFCYITGLHLPALEEPGHVYRVRYRMQHDNTAGSITLTPGTLDTAHAFTAAAAAPLVLTSASARSGEWVLSVPLLVAAGKSFAIDCTSDATLLPNGTQDIVCWASVVA